MTSPKLGDIFTVAGETWMILGRVPETFTYDHCEFWIPELTDIEFAEDSILAMCISNLRATVRGFVDGFADGFLVSAIAVK